jgi:hypothetical protein
MSTQQFITALLIMLSAISWGVVALPVSVAEPGILSLLSAAGIAVVVITLMRRYR